MKKLTLTLAACLAVAVITMAQAPVVMTPGAPSMLNAFTPIGGTGVNVPALKQSGSSLVLRLADDSGNADFGLKQLFMGVSSNTLVFSSTTPTISSGFGTSPSVVAGVGTSSFRVNVGTGGVATSGVVGLPTASTGWNCQVTDLSNNTVTRETASTTTTVTVTAASAWAASDILIFNCAAF